MRTPLLIALVVLLAATSLHAEQSDIDTGRTHVWSNVTYKAGFGQSGFGLFARFGSRYNVAFDKQVDGVAKDDSTQDSWLNELFIGPSYSTSLNPSLRLTTSPQYRPMFWYTSEAKDADPKSYVEHSIHWPTSLTYKIGSTAVTYRLILWNRFGTEFTQNGQDKTTDDEFLTRHYLGVSVPIGKTVRISLAEEVFLLHTANEGQETFWRNAVWADATIKTGVKGLAVQVGYANYYTFKEDSTARKVDINDHYLRLGLVYSMQFDSKQ